MCQAQEQGLELPPDTRVSLPSFLLSLPVVLPARPAGCMVGCFVGCRRTQRGEGGTPGRQRATLYRSKTGIDNMELLAPRPFPKSSTEAGRYGERYRGRYGGEGRMQQKGTEAETEAETKATRHRKCNAAGAPADGRPTVALYLHCRLVPQLLKGVMCGALRWVLP